MRKRMGDYSFLTSQIWITMPMEVVTVRRCSRIIRETSEPLISSMTRKHNPHGVRPKS